jgi:hypothetical protein
MVDVVKFGSEKKTRCLGPVSPAIMCNVLIQLYISSPLLVVSNRNELDRHSVVPLISSIDAE